MKAETIHLAVFQSIIEEVNTKLRTQKILQKLITQLSKQFLQYPPIPLKLMNLKVFTSSTGLELKALHTHYIKGIIILLDQSASDFNIAIVFCNYHFVSNDCN